MHVLVYEIQYSVAILAQVLRSFASLDFLERCVAMAPKAKAAGAKGKAKAGAAKAKPKVTKKPAAAGNRIGVTGPTFVCFCLYLRYMYKFIYIYLYINQIFMYIDIYLSQPIYRYSY